MNNEQIKKNDLELAGVFINLHERLVQFAHYNHEELSPLAEQTLKTWLTKTMVNHIWTMPNDLLTKHCTTKVKSYDKAGQKFQGILA